MGRSGSPGTGGQRAGGRRLPAPRGAVAPQRSGPSPPPPLPLADDRGCRLRTRVSAERRRLVRRTLVRPLLLLLMLVGVFVVLGVTRPTADGPLIPEVLEAVLAALPGLLSGLDPLQVLLAPFLLIGLFEVARGARYARRTARAVLHVNITGRLVQTDGITEHVDLDHLLHVDVAPNRAFTDLNERTPVGSTLVLRLTDATGAEVDVNPGMWAEEQAVVDIVRHHAWHGRCAITAEAAERYALPVRDPHGEPAPTGASTQLGPPRTEEEREAALLARGIDVERRARDAQPRRRDPDVADPPASPPPAHA